MMITSLPNRNNNHTKPVNFLAEIENDIWQTGDEDEDIWCDGQTRGILTSKLDQLPAYITFCLAYVPDDVPENERAAGIKIVDGKLPGYDIAVHDAICTLCLNNHNKQMLVSYADIYRVLSGDLAARPNEHTIQKVKASVQRLCGTHGELNFTHEPQRVLDYFEIHGTRTVYRDALLYCGECQIENRNTKVSPGIRVAEKPILLQYALSRGQVISVPSEVIAVPLRMTDKTVAIRDYLCKYILCRKSGYSNHKIIHYQTILDNSGVKEADTRMQKRRDFDIICCILNHFRETNFIVSFKDDYQNQRFRINV